MGWDGMGWDGMGWDGMGWDGMGCTCLPSSISARQELCRGSWGGTGIWLQTSVQPCK